MGGSDDIRPWDRQPGETSKGYEAFVIYRDMGADRTTRATAEALTKSETLIKTWSSKNDWVRRAAAWDSMPGQVVVQAYEEMAADIAQQHRALSDKLMARLSKNLDLLPDGADPSIKWSTAQAAAHRGHSFATDLSKPKDTAADEIRKKIGELIERLAGGDE